MFGVRLRSLFTSRWMALLWAVLVILTAVQWVGSDDPGTAQGADAASVDDLTPEQQRAIANAL